MVRLAGEFLSLILHKIFGRIKQVFLVYKKNKIRNPLWSGGCGMELGDLSLF